MLELKELHVDEEMHKLLPVLSDEEFAGLKEDIEEHGCREPIVVWTNHAVVLDGRHRLRACLELGVDAEVVEYHFPTKEDAQEWMWRNQIQKRNLNPVQKAEILGRLQKRSEKQEQIILTQSASKTPGRPKSARKSAAEKVAKDTKISKDSVLRSRELLDAMEAIEAVNGKFAHDIREGTIKLPKKDIIALAKGDIPTAIKNVRNGKAWNFKGKPSGGGTFDPGEWEEPSVVRDSIDRPVPKHLKGQYDATASLMSEGNRVDPIKRAIAKLAEEPGGAFLPLSEINELLKKAKGLIQQSRYYTECPKCKGKVSDDCSRCDGFGFIPHSKRGQLSEGEKQWLGI